MRVGVAFEMGFRIGADTVFMLRIFRFRDTITTRLMISFYGSDAAVDGYSDENPPAGNVFIVQGGSGQGAQPAEPSPANPVIHEYNFNSEPVQVAGKPPAFTIMLKNGSTRLATASWVQGGELHYLDLQSRQMLLPAEVIDREATERANAEKSLRLDLPPG